MAVIKANVNGNPNVGLFGVVVADTLLFGEKIREKELFEKALGLRMLRIKIAGTDIPGIMCASNTKKLLVPHLIFDAEKKILEDNDIPYAIIETNTTCLGNTIACNENGAILSTDFTENEVKRIEDALGVPCVQHDIAGITTPGAIIAIHNDRAIVHKDADEEDVKIIEETLQVSVEPATVNLGSPHIRAGILHSDKGLIIGDHSGGPEIVNIDNALGYNQVKE